MSGGAWHPGWVAVGTMSGLASVMAPVPSNYEYEERLQLLLQQLLGHRVGILICYQQPLYKPLQLQPFAWKRDGEGGAVEVSPALLP